FGGRLFESSRWREVADASLLTSRPPRLVDACAFAAPRPPKLPFAARFVPELFIERIGMCEAAEFGAVRATTARLCTEDGGTETRPRALTAPVKLFRVGVNETLLVTRAPLKEAWVMRTAPRFTICPLTKPLREVAVTARTLRA